MKLQFKAGTTSKRIEVFIQDSSSTTGAGLTGLTNASSGLTWYFGREDDGNAGGTAVSIVSATRGTFTSGGFVEKDATNMPGVYELGIPNAALAAGSTWVTMLLKGATNMAPLPVEIELVAYDPYDTVRMGMTSLPNVAFGAVGGLSSRVIQTGSLDSCSTTQAVFTTADLGANYFPGMTIGVVGTTLGTTLQWRVISSTTYAAGAYTVTFDRALDTAPTGTITYRIEKDPLLIALSYADVQAAANDAINGNTTINGTAANAASAAGDSATAATQSTAAATSAATAVTDIGTLTTTIGTPAGASVSADIAGVQTSANAIVTTLGTPAGASVSADIANVPNTVWDQANGIETGITPRQALQLSGAVLAGKISGADGTTVTIKGLNNSTSRVVATVDTNGNRSAVTLTPS